MLLRFSKFWAQPKHTRTKFEIDPIVLFRQGVKTSNLLKMYSRD